MNVLLKTLGLSLLLLISIANSFSNEEVPFFLEEKRLQGELKADFAEIDPRFSLKLFRFDILEGVSIAARYRYEVERSHKDGFHTRVDEWNVVTSINPGDRIDVGMPLNFGLSRGSSIYFIRQFKTKGEAIKAKPYTPLRMPFNAQQAIDKLQVGDFVSLPTRMTFSVGSSKSTDNIDGTISSYYMLSGQFILNIIRMDKNKVQVRVIAQNGKDLGGGGSLGFSFKAFELVVKGKSLEKVIDLDLAKIGFSKGKGNQFVLDYIYDLNNEEAAKAYNKLLSSSLKFKDFDLIKDYLRNRSIEDTVVASFAASDFLHLVDRNRKEKRVSRLFKGFNNFNTSKVNVGFNLKIAKMKKNRTLSKNVLVEEKDSKRRDYYLFHNYSVNQNHAYGIWPLRIKERKYSNIFALLEVDKDLQTKERFPDIGLSYDIRDMRLGDRERRAILGHIHKNFPSYVLSQVDWKNWREDDKRDDALLYVNMIINRNAFKEIPTMTRDELHLRLKQYRDRVREEVGGSDMNDFDPIGWATNPRAVKKASKYLHKFLFDNELTPQQRLDSIIELRRNRTFRELGFGFLLSLLPADKIQDSIYANIELQASEQESLVFTYGNETQKDFYDYLQYITWALNGRSYDTRFVNKNSNPDHEEVEDSSILNYFY